MTTRTMCALAALTVGLCACGEQDEVARQLRHERWATDRRSLADQLDELEDRLITDQARVRFWQELRSKHESVTAIACTNLSEHAAGVALNAERQQQKIDALERRGRVAVHFDGAVTNHVR